MFIYVTSMLHFEVCSCLEEEIKKSRTIIYMFLFCRLHPVKNTLNLDRIIHLNI